MSITFEYSSIQGAWVLTNAQPSNYGMVRYICFNSPKGNIQNVQNLLEVYGEVYLFCAFDSNFMPKYFLHANDIPIDNKTPVRATIVVRDCPLISRSFVEMAFNSNFSMPEYLKKITPPSYRGQIVEEYFNRNYLHNYLFVCLPNNKRPTKNDGFSKANRQHFNIPKDQLCFMKRIATLTDTQHIIENDVNKWELVIFWTSNNNTFKEKCIYTLCSNSTNGLVPIDIDYQLEDQIFDETLHLLYTIKKFM
jgi:hypothetical protein